MKYFETKFQSGKKSSWMNRLLMHGDRPWMGLIIFMALLTVFLMLAIGYTLVIDSNHAITKFGLDFIKPMATNSWDPVNDKFNAWPFIYGTLITSFVAVLIAVPLSLGIAIFLSEICPISLRNPVGMLVELLAAIPSVVYGLWGIFIFLPQIIYPMGNVLSETLGKLPFLNIILTGPISQSGASRLAAGFILAIMITPTIAAVTRDVFLAIPSSQREASLALGATRWETISRVLLPYGLSGILGAVILGLGRALGETMAVTMVIGNSIEGSLSVLRPGYTMSSIIANEFAEAVSKMHTEVLIEIGLILFVMTLVLNSIARLLVWRVNSKFQQEVRA